MSVVADLHVHTTASDGTLELEQVIDRAREAPLIALAITDHDRVHPDMSAVFETRGELTIVRGIEVKVERGSGAHIDLLGIGVERTDAVESLTCRLQEDRIERARAIRSRVEERLDIRLQLEERSGIGRPHIARAIASHPDVAMDVQTAFDELIGDGRPCFVRRDIPEYRECADVLRGAADVVAVAHPLRYDDVEDALDAAADLGAVERWYPYEQPVDLSPVDDAIDRHGLLAVGGSDAHGEGIGRTGLDAEAFSPIKDAIGIGH